MVSIYFFEEIFKAGNLFMDTIPAAAEQMFSAAPSSSASKSFSDFL